MSAEHDRILSTVVDQPPVVEAGIQPDQGSARPWVIGGVALLSVAALTLVPTKANAHPAVRHATIGTQSVLDFIHHIAVPGDPWKPTQKAWVNPSSAALTGSKVTFTTDCGEGGGSGQWGNTWSYHSFRLSPDGLHANPCSIPPSGNYQLPNHGQYRPKLQNEGDKIQAAVGLSATEEVTKISGNHAAITAVFDISDGGSVSAVTIRKDKTYKISYAAS